MLFLLYIEYSDRMSVRFRNINVVHDRKYCTCLVENCPKFVKNCAKFVENNALFFAIFQVLSFAIFQVRTNHQNLDEALYISLMIIKAN